MFLIIYCKFQNNFCLWIFGYGVTRVVFLYLSVGWCPCSIKYFTVPDNSHLRHCACAISQSLVRRCVIFISSVTVRVRILGLRLALIIPTCRANLVLWVTWQRDIFGQTLVSVQAHGDKKLGPVMYLPLAEKMTLKYIEDGKLEAEAGYLCSSLNG